eukprot:TRINITY_DN453_c0_g1_i1.p1 TRINITY_DN453_c0_g1~~TRINITY_DN453_c0_g1_i1.p1  ORF type:complete len:323 (+),score=66.31 TRINITY_DN453_c0_g1_i1:338-1306(+)
MASSEHKGVITDVSKDGAFQRKPSSFREFIKVGSDQFPPEPDRYHLYISYACPWACRCLIVRALKGLDHVIGLSIVDYYMGERGWKFSTNEETEGCIPDTINNAQYVRDLYFLAKSDYDGRFTVPILWDKKTKTIVNNESSEIIRMFNTEFNQWAKHPEVNLYPEDLQKEINEINDYIYPNINNGVYRSGFATTQGAYEEAVKQLFAALDKIEEKLSHSRYLLGDRFTEADVRLFTTLIRFDAVYVGHFKCNIRQLKEYPALLGYTKEIYQMEAIRPTVNFTHIKRHYYQSHASINPHHVVPLGPVLDFLETPHNRENVGKK